MPLFWAIIGQIALQWGLSTLASSFSGDENESEKKHDAGFGGDTTADSGTASMDKPVQSGDSFGNRDWFGRLAWIGCLAVLGSWSVPEHLNAQGNHTYGAQYGAGEGSLISVNVNVGATELTCTWESTIFANTTDKVILDQFRGGAPQDPDIGAVTQYSVTQGGATPLGLTYQINGVGFALKVISSNPFNLMTVRKTLTVSLTDATFQHGDVITVTHSGSNGTQMKYVDITLDLDTGQQGPTLSDFVVDQLDCESSPQSLQMTVKSTFAWQYTAMYIYKCDQGGANVDYGTEQGGSQGVLQGNGSAEWLFLGNGSINFYDWEYCFVVFEVRAGAFDENPTEIITTWAAIRCNQASSGCDCCCEKLDLVIAELQIANATLLSMDGYLSDIRDSLAFDPNEDTDGDGVPDHEDTHPEDSSRSDGSEPPPSDPDDGGDWEFLGDLTRFDPGFSGPSIGVDTEAIVEKSYDLPIGMDVPGMGLQTFTFQTMPDNSTQFGQIVNNIRVPVRNLLTALCGFGFLLISLRLMW